MSDKEGHDRFCARLTRKKKHASPPVLSQAIEQRALDAMMDYLREYLNLVKEAVPVEGDGPLAEISAGQADYCDYR